MASLKILTNFTNFGGTVGCDISRQETACHDNPDRLDYKRNNKGGTHGKM